MSCLFGKILVSSHQSWPRTQKQQEQKFLFAFEKPLPPKNAIPWGTAQYLFLWKSFWWKSKKNVKQEKDKKNAIPRGTAQYLFSWKKFLMKKSTLHSIVMIKVECVTKFSLHLSFDFLLNYIFLLVGGYWKCQFWVFQIHLILLKRRPRVWLKWLEMSELGLLVREIMSGQIKWDWNDNF